LLDFLSLPVFGWLSGKIGREKVMLAASGWIAVASIPLMGSLVEGSLFKVLIIRCCFVLSGVAFFAPFFAYTLQLIPKRSRVLIVSFSYAIGSQLIGAPTAALSLYLFHTTSLISSAGWYVAFLAFISFVSILRRGIKPSECYS
jgi:MFS family permease